jgi:ankyrin repeat protein
MSGDASLHTACHKGAFDTVVAMLQKPGCNVDAAAAFIGYGGRLPLVLACNNGHHEIARLLLKSRADVDHATNTGKTALHAVSARGDVDMVRILVHEAGASVDSKTANGTTPLMIAARRGHYELVKLLVASRADVHHFAVGGMAGFSTTPLIAAVRGGHFEIVKWLVDKCGVTISRHKAQGYTAVSLSAYLGHLRITKCLMSSRNSTTVPAPGGCSLLYAATSNNQVATVRWLLERDASMIDHKHTRTRLTPLGFAAIAKYDLCVISLVAARADISTIPKHVCLSPNVIGVVSRWNNVTFTSHINALQKAVTNALPWLHADVVRTHARHNYHHHTHHTLHCTHTCHAHTHNSNTQVSMILALVRPHLVELMLSCYSQGEDDLEANTRHQ